MSTTTLPRTRFDPRALSGLDEPVRRYLTHAIAEGCELGGGVRLHMTGRIDVGRWLSFSADQDVSEHGFSWRARAGWGSFKVMHVVDSYADGIGSTEGKLLGRVRFMHAADGDTARSAAGRAAVERILLPSSLLPGPGVSWRAEADDRIVASLVVAPERPEVTLHVTATGAVRDVGVSRWGDAGQDGFGYLPFGGAVMAERRFGDLVVPSRLSVGWWFGTPRYKPFFEATILTATPSR